MISHEVLVLLRAARKAAYKQPSWRIINMTYHYACGKSWKTCEPGSCLQTRDHNALEKVASEISNIIIIAKESVNFTDSRKEQLNLFFMLKDRFNAKNNQLRFNVLRWLHQRWA